MHSSVYPGGNRYLMDYLIKEVLKSIACLVF